MFILGVGPTLNTGLGIHLIGTLEAPCFFESPMTSLFHESLPMPRRTVDLAQSNLVSMAEEFDPGAMIERFRHRATAVRNRGLPPVEGPERRRFMEQAKVDFMDFAMVGDAQADLADGVLTLRIDLRPTPPASDGQSDTTSI